MFKPRSPFLIPSLPGSNIIQKRGTTMDQERKRQMSIQPPSIKQTQVTPVTPTVFDEKFCFSLQKADENDQSLLWTYDLTNQVTNQSKRNLIFSKQQYYLSKQSQSEVFQTIYIVVDSINGYCDKNGISTNRVCALHLVQVTPSTFLKQTTYDLVYKQVKDAVWEIPMNLTKLNFRIQREDELYNGDLLTPLVCQFNIRHSGN